MGYIKDSPFYKDAIHEIEYPFGTFYLFDNFLVAEINEGIVFTWDHHAKKVVEDLTHLYDQNGEDVVYITNRVHAYSVMPSDWIKFYRNNFKLKGYAVVSYSPKGILNTIIEKIFIKSRFKTFENLEDAIYWATQISKHIK